MIALEVFATVTSLVFWLIVGFVVYAGRKAMKNPMVQMFLSRKGK